MYIPKLVQKAIAIIGRTASMALAVPKLNLGRLSHIFMPNHIKVISEVVSLLYTVTVHRVYFSILLPGGPIGSVRN